MAPGPFDDPADGVPADAPSSLTRPDDLVATLARFLRRVHRSDPHSDAIMLTPESAIEEARGRLATGDIDPASFDPPYQPHDPVRLIEIAAGLAGHLTDAAPVTVHGRLHLADLRLTNGEVVGWAVPEAQNAGDPYVDLSWLARDLSMAIGPGAVPALFDAYGLERPDPVRIELWVTLRQLLA